MTRKKNNHGLGSALIAQRKKAAASKVPTLAHTVDPEEKAQVKSVLDRSSLDDFLVSAQMAGTHFEAERRTHIVGGHDSRAVVALDGSDRPSLTEEQRRALHVPIPRRPAWDRNMDAKVLQKRENEAFLDWRRYLATIEETDGVVVTTYEKNLDFWRQLWRVVERSDLVVQIIDARDPLFYRNGDLEKYIREIDSRKRVLLLLNKADLVPQEHRAQWAKWFTEQHSGDSDGLDASAPGVLTGSNGCVRVVFFSALREMAVQDRRDPAAAPAPVSTEPKLMDGQRSRADEEEAAKARALEALSNATDVLSCEDLLDLFRKYKPAEGTGTKPTIGFVGFPNVGKSSVINALLGAKKVSMSRQPGKTKHFQTLDLPEHNVTLCDCPGLVFPSVVASASHLAIKGVSPIDTLGVRIMQAVDLIVAALGVSYIANHYRCGTQYATLSVPTLRGGGSGYQTAPDYLRLLAAMSMARGHLLRGGAPDEHHAARRLLRDVTSGRVLLATPPPGTAPTMPEQPPLPPPDVEAARASLEELESDSEADGPRETAALAAPAACSSDAADPLLEEFLKEAQDRERAAQPQRVTKRKMRQLQRQAEGRGGKVTSVGGYGY